MNSIAGLIILYVFHQTVKSFDRGHSNSMKNLRKDITDTMQGFSSLAQAATQNGALDKKTKELIALAIGVSTRCDGCIGFHTEALIKLGVTREEFEEVIGMAVYMGRRPVSHVCSRRFTCV